MCYYAPVEVLERAPKVSPRRRDEAWLASIWERQSFDRHALRTTSGVAFQVVYPGRRTGEAGPDFHDAILALPDGSLLRGEVEIHLESGGWEHHGHQRDPAYDRVLLHVVLAAAAPTFTSQGKPVLTLELAGRLTSKRSHEPARTAESPAGDSGTAQLSYVVAPCQQHLPRRAPAGLQALLHSLALERFQTKQAVFEGELAVYEPEQVLYAGLLEALGYSRNRVPFRGLAALAPLVALPRRAEAIERLLLEMAGLIQGGQAVQAGVCAQPLDASEWQTVGVRPDNWPARRITQFATILARLRPGSLLDELLGPLSEAGPLDAKSLRDEWGRMLREVGPQRANAMAINVLLPFAAAYGQATCQFGLSELAVEAFLAFPAAGANQVTSYMRRTILGPLANAATNAPGEQALLHVWDRWCHEKVCAVCPLGARSRQPAVDPLQ